MEKPFATCMHCGAEMNVREVITYNLDDGGSIDSLDIDYVVDDDCYNCHYEAYMRESSHDEEELPF